MKQNGQGFVVGATANYLVSCHLWLLLNWKIEFFECALKPLKVFLSSIGQLYYRKK